MKWTSYRGFGNTVHVPNVYLKPNTGQNTEGYHKLYDCCRTAQSRTVEL